MRLLSIHTCSPGSKLLYCLFKKSLPILYPKLLYKLSQDFLDILYCFLNQTKNLFAYSILYCIKKNCGDHGGGGGRKGSNPVAVKKASSPSVKASCKEANSVKPSVIRESKR